MTRTVARRGRATGQAAGFAVLDVKGRLTLPKPVRSALRVDAGSTVAYVLAGDALLVVPQDALLAELMERASSAVSAAGLSATDYLDEIPAARQELIRERYGSLSDRDGEAPDQGGSAGTAAAAPSTRSRA